MVRAIRCDCQRRCRRGIPPSRCGRTPSLLRAGDARNAQPCAVAMLYGGVLPQSFCTRIECTQNSRSPLVLNHHRHMVLRCSGGPVVRPYLILSCVRAVGCPIFLLLVEQLPRTAQHPQVRVSARWLLLWSAVSCVEHYITLVSQVSRWYNLRMNMDSMRHQLIECASFRPNDIKAFYDKWMLYANGCSFLSTDAPHNIAMLYRGRLRHYDARLVPFALAGVDPEGKKICNNDNCLNPDHVI